MNCFLLHFKQHVHSSFHTDVELLLHQYPPIQWGGPLYFSLLMSELVLSNEQSCDALVSLVKVYDIAKDGKDDLLATIKLLCSATKSIVAMRSDGSKRNKLPNLFVKNMLEVLQTSSVEAFSFRMKQFSEQLEFRQLETSDCFELSTLDALKIGRASSVELH